MDEWIYKITFAVEKSAWNITNDNFLIVFKFRSTKITIFLMN